MQARTRREVLQGGAGLAAASLLGGLWPDAALAQGTADGDWDAGPIRHLLPTATHDRVLVKASFARALDDAPRLRIGGTTVAGRRSDSHGRFWRWDAGGLDADRSYRLRLVDDRGRGLAEPWRLRTFPRPDARPEGLRLLIFTCAGGNDIVRQAGFNLFQPARVRERLLKRGLSFEPDAVIANGDHVYWDLEAGVSARVMTQTPLANRRVGEFRPSARALGGHNEEVLRRAAGPQIVPLYGTACREVPTFFLTDDHDYFENDEASDALITFPPRWWKLQLARATQRLYYPEFLAVPGQPPGLPWSQGSGRRRLFESFGALRYGRLLEFLMYDVRRTVTLEGPSAVFVDRSVERWITGRLRARDVTHVVTMPSNPPGYTAGKWGEWYPDVLGPDRRLTTSLPKPYWQAGWLAQHDRLMSAISARRQGVALVVAGDIHATAAATVFRSGAHDLRANPVHVALSGTLGTDDLAFPSAFRGVRPEPPAHLDARQDIEPIEENGFTIADVRRDRIVLRFFRWNSETQREEEIDRLRPFRTMELPAG